jgi:serine/threonine-protein kinase PknG
VPTADPADPNTGLLASLAAASPDQVAAALEKAQPSPEVALRLAQAYIVERLPEKARQVLDTLTAEIVDDWRISWWTGIQALDDRRWDRAIECFDGVYTAVPGELAPKLALACAYELAGTPGRAIPYYALVARTDPGSAYASFGLARSRLAGGDRDGAVDALRRVPATSSAHARAQVMLCHVLSIDIDGNGPHLHDLQLASDTIAQLTTDVETRIVLTRGLLESALTHLTEGVLTPDGSVHLAGVTLDERGVRRGLETACRELARYAPTRAEQIALIDQANRYRPVSLL